MNSSLAKLFPNPSSFEINYEGTVTKVYLKASSLNDYLKLDKLLNGIEAALNNANLENLSKIAYFLMISESKSLFKAREIESFDMDGKPIIEPIGGWQLLMNYFTTADELKNMMMAILTSLGVPEKNFEEVKKNLQAEPLGP